MDRNGTPNPSHFTHAFRLGPPSHNLPVDMCDLCGGHPLDGQHQRVTEESPKCPACRRGGWYVNGKFYHRASASTSCIFPASRR